jgi:predicted ATPase
LAEHRGVARAAFAAFGGVEVDTEGDAFFYAFPTAPGALAAATKLTEALVSGPIRVRVGIHTGTPLLDEEGYVGEDVHRAARIASSGHGGQVLVSASTASLVSHDGLRDLGEHRLKDLSAPERIYQLGESAFPALTSIYRTNLPIPATRFLGREPELAEVASLLARGDVRLLTLTGPGGTGKTRLALQAAGEASELYPDGVYWVPLALLRDPTLVLEEAAQALGSQDGLAAHIADKAMLLLFDNFEQVVEAASGLAELLASCPRLGLLVTSRELLQVPGEHVYPVPPLADEDGIELFTVRARTALPSFASGAAVPELCAKLEQLPLALELAAARVRAMSPEQLLERLSGRLDLLKAGRGVDPRQQTLRATIEWSYDLLSRDEQQLFRCLAIFRGGCTMRAAEEVCDADLDTLQALVDKSLLRFSNERYWMLETIREYAVELLQGSHEYEAVRDRHLSCCLALAEEAEPRLTGPDQRQWFERLALEQDNMREALDYACESGDGERALMLAGTIWRFWWTRGQIAEASFWYDRAFAAGGNVSETARARGVFGAAHAAEARGDGEEARIRFEEAVDLLRRIGETRWLVLAMTHLARLYPDTRRQESLQEEALALAEGSGDRRGAAIVKGNLAWLRMEEGDNDPASELLHQALDAHRALGDVYGAATTLDNLARIALRQGDLEVAAAEISEGLALSRSIGDALTIASMLGVAAAVVLARRDAHAAAQLCAAGEALVRVHGFDPELAGGLLGETKRAAEAVLGDGFGVAFAAGADLDLEAAVECALEALV